MSASKHVMLMPDILFLVFEQLPLRRLCRYRLVCKDWDNIYRAIKDSTLSWRNTEGDDSSTTSHNEAAFAGVSRVTTLQCDFVQLLGDREAQSKLDLATKSFLESFSDRCRRGKLDGWREWILTGWFNPFVVIVPHAAVMPWTLERLSMTISRPVTVDVLSILFRLPQLVSFELRWSNLGITGMIESQYVHFPIPSLEAGSTLEQAGGLEGSYPSTVDKVRLERLKINGFRLTPKELLTIAQKAPHLEFIQLIQGLKGSWSNCDLETELGLLCPNLQHVHISGNSGSDDTDPVYRSVLKLIANLPQTVKSVGLRHAIAHEGESEDNDPILQMDTLQALGTHCRHLTSLYISQFYPSDHVTHQLFHCLAKLEHLEAFYAPFMSEFDIYSLDPSHPRHFVDASMPPFTFPKLKALELTFANSAKTTNFRIHSMSKSVNAILKTIVRSMPNLEHLLLRLGSKLVLDSNAKLRRLGQLRNLKTLVVVARMDDDLWEKKTLDWLRPSTSGNVSFGSPGSHGKKIFSSGKSSPPLSHRLPKDESHSNGGSGNRNDTTNHNNSITGTKRTQQFLPNLQRLELIRTGNQTPLNTVAMDARSTMWFQAAKDYLAEIRPEIKTVLRHKYSREIGRLIFHSEYDDTFVLRQF